MSSLDRDRRQTTCVVFSVLVPTHRESKETGETDFGNVFYLTRVSKILSFPHVISTKNYQRGIGNLGFLDGSVGKESTCRCRRHRFYPWVGKIPWRRK